MHIRSLACYTTGTHESSFWKRHPNKGVTRLGAALRGLNRAAQDQSVSDGIAAANRFYDILLKYCGTQLPSRFFSTSITVSISYEGCRCRCPAAPSAAEIAPILQAIEARDAEATAKACEVHVRNAAEAALKILAERGHLS